MAEIKIVWSEEAIKDIEEIISYISKDSELYAVNFASKIIGSVDSLRVYPEIGRIVPEFNNSEIREIIYRNYRIVYRISGKTIEIVTIFHGSKLING
ncbi:MAG: type II toxin-antitoxin system RelE/ParE family toxin [Spirochaetales bacterium]|nr:type II toxin-antitoxin system RelE/ParE family toxin [Spirochaetales bacterium]